LRGVLCRWRDKEKKPPRVFGVAQSAREAPRQAEKAKHHPRRRIPPIPPATRKLHSGAGKKALISVSDKTGVVDLAKVKRERGQ
jgi:hypothetical protein